MSVPISSPSVNPKTAALVIVVAAAVVLGYFALIGVGTLSTLSSSRSSATPPGTSKNSTPPPSSGASLSVFSHTGTVNHAGHASRGVNGTYGPATVFNRTSAISTGPTTTTPPMGVQAGSRVFVFVGYANAGMGGGTESLVTDSLSDPYTFVLASGDQVNHSEDLWESGPIPSNASLSISASFSDGNVTMGGTVSAVDAVSHIGTPTIDVVYANRGTGSTAQVLVTTTLPGDLLLLGVSGPGAAAPFVPGSGETLLNTSEGPTGPGATDTGFGLFSAAENESPTTLTASLAMTDDWGAIGVGVYGLQENGTPGTTTTPNFSVANGSVIFLFVGYVNSMIGGGEVANVTDTLGDSYSPVLSTDLAQNHSEVLYTSSPVEAVATTSVTVSFVSENPPMGGSVAAVDVVASSGLPVIDRTDWTTGPWSGTASVSVATPETGELLLLGVSGMGRDAPFNATANETLLDTGTNTSGPFFDGTGFGTFSAVATGSITSISATLHTAAEWEAIGVAISTTGHSGTSGAVSGSGAIAGIGPAFLAVAGAMRPK